MTYESAYMKEFFKEFRTALNEIAITFLFFIPCTCKNEKKITKAISKKIKILRLSRRYFTHNAHRAMLQAEPQGS